MSIDLPKFRRIIKHLEQHELPPGYFTREMYCKETGEGKDVACKKIGALIDAGKIEIGFFSIPRRDGRLKTVPAYRLRGK